MDFRWYHLHKWAMLNFIVLGMGYMLNGPYKACCFLQYYIVLKLCAVCKIIRLQHLFANGLWSFAMSRESGNLVSKSMQHLQMNFKGSHLHIRGRSQATLTRFLIFFDHLLPCVCIFYVMNVDKKIDIFGLPTYLVL